MGRARRVALEDPEKLARPWKNRTSWQVSSAANSSLTRRRLCREEEVFAVEQITASLKQAELGTPIADLELLPVQEAVRRYGAV
jgi:hypothetical protein